MSLVKSWTTWLRQTLGWSNSRASWQERLALGLFLFLAASLGVLSFWLALWQSALLWAIYFVAVAVGTRQGWLQLFGPVLFYDMIRSARQSRYTVLRLLYAGLLLVILCFLYLDVSARNRMDVSMFFVHLAAILLFLLWLAVLLTGMRFVQTARARASMGIVIAVSVALFVSYIIFLGLSDERDMTPRESAVLAEAYFMAFMLVQLTLVAVLTPAYVAGAIADEKERRTLEFMLATDLSNHEIVLSKFLSRLANMAMFLLTGLPILSILQFMGGVDPELMLAGFAGTGLTVLGIAALSILFSTLLKKPRDAIGLTYLAIIAYCAIGVIAKIMVLNSAILMTEPLWEEGPSLGEFTAAYNIGNPITAMVDVGIAIDSASLATRLPEILAGYAWFHGVLAPVCIAWSVLRLRAVALKQTVAGKAQKAGWWRRYRPVVGDLPMMWKELYLESRAKLNWLGWGIAIVLVLLAVGSGVVMLGAYLWDTWTAQNRFWNLAQDMNVWFRVAGTGVALLLLLIVSVRASTAISSERERDTFDALLTTPMSAEAMLSAKLLGCLTSLRLGWLWYGSLLAIAVVSGGLHPLAAPLLVAAWFVYALLFTMVGMWYSMVCASSMRATVATVLTVLLLGGGHWLVLGMCLYFPLAMMGPPGEFIEYLAKFQAGLTPPFVLAFLSFSWENLAHDMHHDREFGAQMVAFSLIGMFLWGAACAILWYGLLLPKFRDLTRREQLAYR